MTKYSLRDIEYASAIEVQYANIDTGEYDSGIVFEATNDDIYMPWKGRAYSPLLNYDWEYYSNAEVLDCMNERDAIVEIYE